MKPLWALLTSLGNSDGGLPASRLFAKVHPRLGLPLNALILTSVIVVHFGLIFLGSTRYVISWCHRGPDCGLRSKNSAFNAIISASVVALDMSYAMPIAVNCLQGRNTLPERKWRLPSWFGWTADLIALAYISLTTVLFLFPPTRPVTGTNMSESKSLFSAIACVLSSGE